MPATAALGSDPLGRENAPMPDQVGVDALDALRARWTQALEAARATPDNAASTPDNAPAPDPIPYADNLLARWQEPQRRYHTLTHLTAVLDHIDVLERELERDLEQAGHRPAPTRPPLVRLAAWFHDAVYPPDRSENEERSARLAERALARGRGAPEKTAEVARLVRLTVTHDPAADDPTARSCATPTSRSSPRPPDTYAAYTAAVREEYAFVPNDAFRAGPGRRTAPTPRPAPAVPDAVRSGAVGGGGARYNIAAELELL